MRVTLHFHGPLRTGVPEPVTVEASNAAEAIEAVTRQIAFFRPDPIQGLRRLQLVGFDNVEDLFKPLEQEVIHVVPPISFEGGDNGIVQIVVGTVLIVAGIFLPLPPQLKGYLISAGVSMVIGGLLQLIAPQPEMDGVEPGRQSLYMGSPGNTAEIGTPIQIIYGMDLAQGHILGLDVDAAKFSGET